MFSRRRWAPAVVWVPAIAVAGAALLPLAYLVVRTFGGGSETWDVLFRLRVLEILGRTVLLVAGVAAGSIALAVPLAWLTVRTNLPLRNLWAVLTALPLVIPSYIGALSSCPPWGPRGCCNGCWKVHWG